MFRFVALFALVSCAYAGVLPDGRIVGGVDTTIEKYPYQVSIQSSKGSHFCGGSIVKEDIIVTAAHCMVSQTAAKTQVRVGSTRYDEGGEVIDVEDIKVHPGYNSKTMINDVAIMKLKRGVKESSTVRYVKLATDTPKTGTRAVVTGWGVTCYLTCVSTPKILKEVEVDIVDKKDCESKEYKYGSEIKDTMVCAYEVKKDACQGDSGGPLVADDELVGIVSWGYGCAREGYPGVYADVPSLHAWIEDAIKSI
ncbi:trypsin-like [Teleopsis dalmanni]|uniref:trypsin-like n=1 Tax=Teleopsis dalmanni TaxID=139649 RepID=UPI0018CDB4F2|nr:trypsin-like [Teleopsis dalmanni]